MMRKAIAEFIGTFWLVFAGCGSAAFFSAALARGGGDAREMGAIVGLLGIALAFGLTVVTMATPSATSPAATSIPRSRSAWRRPAACP
jgi:aquaporin Z